MCVEEVEAAGVHVVGVRPGPDEMAGGADREAGGGRHARAKPIDVGDGGEGVEFVMYDERGDVEI